jgi:hypothetical protein
MDGGPVTTLLFITNPSGTANEGVVANEKSELEDREHVFDFAGGVAMLVQMVFDISALV